MGKVLLSILLAFSLLFNPALLWAMTIHVKLPSGTIIDVSTESSDSYQQFQQKIQDQTGFNRAESILLTYNGTMLDPGRTFADNTITDGAYLQVIIAAAPQPSQSNILYVNQHGPVSSDQSGSSWANAITDLNSALLWARQQVDNNTASWTSQAPLKIYIAEGTYYPVYDAADGNYDQPGMTSSAFVLVKNVQLLGGFAGFGSPSLADRNWKDYPTVLSGDPLTPTDLTDNAGHVVIAAGPIESAALDGLTVTGGYSNNMTMIVNGQQILFYTGGGMVNSASSPKIQNVIFKANQVVGLDGPNGTFGRPGKAGYPAYGGGMYNDNAQPRLINVSFVENAASGGNGGAGGAGVSAAAGSAQFGGLGGNGGSGGEAGGGGLYNLASSPIVINAVFLKNTTIGGAGGPGGMGGNGGSSNGVPGGPLAPGGSGGAGGNGGNGGGALGGAIANLATSLPQIVNASINSNKITGGAAGLFGSGGGPGMGSPLGGVGMTGLSGQTGMTTGGGIYNGVGSSLKITNSILFGNMTIIQDDEIFNMGGSADLSYCFILGNVASWQVNWGTDSGNNIISAANPFTDVSTGNLTLVNGSAAIDAGNNSSIPTGISSDPAGNQRIQNGTVDMGAYEFNSSTVPVQLLYFNAYSVKNKVHLEWATATESGNKSFMLSRSGDGLSYQALTRIDGKGVSTGKQTYQFDDLAPISGRNYYQLAQQDRNGKIAILSTKSVLFSTLDPAVQIYPNPAADQVHIQLKTAARISLYSVSGVLIRSISGIAGMNSLTVKGLSKGIYFIKVSGQAAHYKLIKQ